MDAHPETFAQRPVVGVSALVQRNAEVLLVRRGRSPGAGRWALPGGRVERGERLEAAAIREIREETSIDIADLAQIDMAEIIGRDAAGAVESHVVLVVFSGRYVGGDVRAGDDAAEARWVRRDALDRLDLTEDTRRVIKTHGPQA
jgi:ADP-ribose pyrophosphatase YjhB (NUDIX family)